MLKPKVIGIKHYDSTTFEKKINDNSTGSVKELIMGFEKITATGVRNLEKRNVLEFTGNMETYQSPGKRAKHDMADPAKQRLRSRRNWPARSEHLTLPSRPGPSSPGSSESRRAKLPGVGTWTPASKACQPQCQSWLTPGGGSWRPGGQVQRPGLGVGREQRRGHRPRA